MTHSNAHRRSLFFLFAILIPACLITSNFEGLRSGSRDAGGGGVSSEAGSSSGDGPTIAGDLDGGDSGASSSVGCRDASSLFCADFDTGEFTAGWTTFDRSDGDGGQDPAIFLSAPFSFSAFTAATTSGDPEATMRLQRDFPATVSKAHLTVGVYIDTVPPDNSRGEIVDLRFHAASVDYHLYVTLRSGVDLLTEYTDPAGGGPPVVDHPLSASVPRGTWTLLDLDVDLGAGSAVVRAGQQVLINETIHPPWTSGSVLLRVGLGVGTPAGAYAVHYDDVKFDAN